MKTTIKILLIILFAGGIFASCKISKETTAAKISLPETFQGQKKDSLSALNWKSFFRDEKLINLIDRALVGNYDMQIALRQIQIANTYYKMSRNARFPSLQLEAKSSFDGKMYGSPGTGKEYSLALGSSWEVDLWGKLNQARKASKSRFLASEYGKQLVQTILISDVAKGYYELLAFDAELEIIRKNIKLQSSAFEIVNVQKQAGKATDLAVHQFDAQLTNTKAQEDEIKRKIVQSENYLNVLLNQLPQPIVRSGSLNGQKFPDEFKVGIPVQLLDNRPDIQVANLMLEASGFDLEAARRALLPSLIVSPLAAFTSSGNTNLLAKENLGWNTLGGLTAPIFQRRQLKGNLEIMKVEQEKALLNYGKVLTQSYIEVSGAIAELSLLEQELGKKTQEVATLGKAINTANQLYAYGYANYLEVINAQKSAREAELALTELQKGKCLLMIDLFRSLGGGR